VKKLFLFLLFIFGNVFSSMANNIEPPKTNKFVVYLITPQNNESYFNKVIHLNDDEDLSKNYSFFCKENGDFDDGGFPVFEIYYGRLKMGTVYGEATKHFFMELFPFLDESSRDILIKKNM
jgi:hypothetical protein